jgi:ribonuclease I
VSSAERSGRMELRIKDSRSPHDLVLTSANSVEPSEQLLRHNWLKYVTVFANRSTKYSEENAVLEDCRVFSDKEVAY